MTEREYPRWVHGEGHASVVVETAEEESAVLAGWAAGTDPVAPPRAANQLTDMAAVEALVVARSTEEMFTLAEIEKAFSDGVVAVLRLAKECGVSDETIALIRGEIEPEVTAAIDEPAKAEVPAEAKATRKGGWPKGKPRQRAAVN